MTQKGMKTCQMCGRIFECGSAAGKPSCWCAELPMIMPVPIDGVTDCLCPDCLADAVRAKIEHAAQGPDDPECCD